MEYLQDVELTTYDVLRGAFLGVSLGGCFAMVLTDHIGLAANIAAATIIVNWGVEKLEARDGRLTSLSLIQKYIDSLRPNSPDDMATPDSNSSEWDSSGLVSYSDSYLRDTNPFGKNFTLSVTPFDNEANRFDEGLFDWEFPSTLFDSDGEQAGVPPIEDVVDVESNSEDTARTEDSDTVRIEFRDGEIWTVPMRQLQTTAVDEMSEQYSLIPFDPSTEEGVKEWIRAEAEWSQIEPIATQADTERLSTEEQWDEGRFWLKIN